MLPPDLQRRHKWSHKRTVSSIYISFYPPAKLLPSVSINHPISCHYCTIGHSLASLVWQVLCDSICIFFRCSDLQSHIKFTVYTACKIQSFTLFLRSISRIFCFVKFIFYTKKSNPSFCLYKFFCPFSIASSPFIQTRTNCP